MKRAFHAGDLWCDHCSSGTGGPGSSAASFRCDGKDPAICTGLYRNYGIWNSVPDFDNRRESSDPRGQKSYVLYDLYADRGNY